MAVETKQMHERARYSFLNFPPYLAYLIGRTQQTRRKIEIDPILAFATQRDASAKEGVHKLETQRNAAQRNVLRHIVNQP